MRTNQPFPRIPESDIPSQAEILREPYTTDSGIIDPRDNRYGPTTNQEFRHALKQNMRHGGAVPHNFRQDNRTDLNRDERNRGITQLRLSQQLFKIITLGVPYKMLQFNNRRLSLIVSCGTTGATVYFSSGFPLGPLTTGAGVPMAGIPVKPGLPYASQNWVPIDDIYVVSDTNNTVMYVQEGFFP